MPTKRLLDVMMGDMSGYEVCRKIQEKDSNGIFAAIKLVGDPNVERAEFILKSPKGTIISEINEQLEQIGEALGKVK